MSEARARLDWKNHLSRSLDPHTAQRMYQEACMQEDPQQTAGKADFCTMCGQHWCSLRVNREIQEQLGKGGQAEAERPVAVD